jgi:hypothetical protein
MITGTHGYGYMTVDGNKVMVAGWRISPVNRPITAVKKRLVKKVAKRLRYTFLANRPSFFGRLMFYLDVTTL